MKQILIILTFIGLIISTHSYSQETEKKLVQKGDIIEEYYVLKDNENIRHGQYVKYQENVLNQMIPVEFGFYENDKKIGEWYFFYPAGSLESFGVYHADQKQGIWKEYYEPLGNPVKSIFNGHRNVVTDENGVVSVEKNDSLLSAMGIHHSGEKVGTWNYYDDKGTLIHVFDHSTDKLIFSSVADSVNQKCPFLGGPHRFSKFYFRDKETIDFFGTLSGIKLILKLEISEGVFTVEKVSSNVRKKTDIKLEQIIQAFPDDWIPTYFDNPLYLTLEFKKDSSKISVYISFDQLLESDIRT